MPQRNQPSRAAVVDLDQWDKEIDGVKFQFVIKRTTIEKPERWERRVFYPLNVRRADNPYLSLGDSFDEQPTREQVEEFFQTKDGFRSTFKMKNRPKD